MTHGHIKVQAIPQKNLRTMANDHTNQRSSINVIQYFLACAINNVGLLSKPKL